MLGPPYARSSINLDPSEPAPPKKTFRSMRTVAIRRFVAICVSVVSALCLGIASFATLRQTHDQLEHVAQGNPPYTLRRCLIIRITDELAPDSRVAVVDTSPPWAAFFRVNLVPPFHVVEESRDADYTVRVTVVPGGTCSDASVEVERVT